MPRLFFMTEVWTSTETLEDDCIRCCVKDHEKEHCAVVSSFHLVEGKLKLLQRMYWEEGV